MLPAGGAGCYGKVGVSCFTASSFNFILSGKPELRSRFALGKGHDGTADTSNKDMYDWSYKWPSFFSRRRT
ncbi:MAG: hypothetical protein A4E66_02159 [Syntrophus sp. PtaB.Bin001]|nr:MAG: hypothetical protein A4E66_02159 [Syntrophus sp. PtaB.Bin001]